MTGSSLEGQGMDVDLYWLTLPSPPIALWGWPVQTSPVNWLLDCLLVQQPLLMKPLTVCNAQLWHLRIPCWIKPAHFLPSNLIAYQERVTGDVLGSECWGLSKFSTWKSYTHCAKKRPDFERWQSHKGKVLMSRTSIFTKEAQETPCPSAMW